MVRGEQAWAKSICVNGIEPNKSTISNNTYPYVSEIYAAVRSDIDKASTAYKLFEYLTTTSGQNIVKESGYVPVSTSTDIKKVTSQSSFISVLHRFIWQENKWFSQRIGY